MNKTFRVILHASIAALSSETPPPHITAIAICCDLLQTYAVMPVAISVTMVCNQITFIANFFSFASASKRCAIIAAFRGGVKLSLSSSPFGSFKLSSDSKSTNKFFQMLVVRIFNNQFTSPLGIWLNFNICTQLLA